MPVIASVSSFLPPYTLPQEMAEAFALQLFKDDFKNIHRLLPIFQNGQIETRQFAVPIQWFTQDRSFKERNDIYVELATTYSVEAIKKCLQPNDFLKEKIDVSAIDAIIFVSSSGIATPTIDVRLMNILSFSPHVNRIPLWGLGCAGGAAGISRAFEYCRAHPSANVLVICVELCSLTFQRNDRTKSNLIGTSLFGDGVACTLVIGSKSKNRNNIKGISIPTIIGTESTLLPQSEDVMGWDITDSGFHVIFSRHIPSIIKKWFPKNLYSFLNNYDLTIDQITSLIAHPGGKKVLDAYKESLLVNEEMVKASRDVLREHGNMSSPTVIYVLERIMKQKHSIGAYGLIAALGPGFSSELALLQWGEK